MRNEMRPDRRRWPGTREALAALFCAAALVLSGGGCIRESEPRPYRSGDGPAGPPRADAASGESTTQETAATGPATMPATDEGGAGNPAGAPSSGVPSERPVVPAAPLHQPGPLEPAPLHDPGSPPTAAPLAPLPGAEAPTNGRAAAAAPTAAAGGGGPESRPSAVVQTLTGTLRGGIVAIGGETTGWVLAGDGAAGGIDVDVTAVEDDARTFDGKRVTVTGNLVEKHWPERGKAQVLVARKIEAATSPNK